jgi:hypothetical protein
MKSFAVIIGFGLLLIHGTAVAADKAKPGCPSLAGDWSGDFDGSFEGTWQATFTQSGTNVNATAGITLKSGQHIEAEGSAEIKCQGSKTEIAGSGSARDKSGSFSGVSDASGKSLSGTWWSGDLFGTWRGQKIVDEP